MTIHFAWVTEDVTFDSRVHAVENEKIFFLELIEKEDEFPKARITIDNPQAGLLHLYPNRKAFLSWKGKLLFTGRVTGLPTAIDEHFIQLELVARPLDLDASLEALNLKPHPLFHPLKTSAARRDADCAALYCDRTTHDLKKSPWFQDPSETLGARHFQNSLQMRVTGEPYSQIKLCLSIQWTQRLQGVMNVGKIVANHFPANQISSFTPLRISSRFPKGQRIGRSGYWVIQSKLKPLQTSLDTLGIYATTSKPLRVDEKTTQSLKRHWYHLDYWMGYRYEQKRQESLDITVPHHVQSLHAHRGPEKTLEVHLQNPLPRPEGRPWLPGLIYFPGSKVWDQGGLYECRKEHFSHLSLAENQDDWKLVRSLNNVPQEDLSSFFLSPLGQEATTYGLQLACWHLDQSTRCVRITFSGLWEDLSHLTTDTSVTLTDPRLPGGSVAGKITTLKLTACGTTGEQVAHVTLTCAVGLGLSLDLTLEDTSSQKPTEGWLEAPVTLVHHVAVINGPTEQESLLEKSQGQGKKAMQEILRKNSTQVHITFVDLRSQEKISHSLSTRSLDGWSAPQDINLSAKETTR